MFPWISLKGNKQYILLMTTPHGCAYYSGLAFIEINRIKSLAEKENEEAVDNHLTLLEREFENVGLTCGFIDLAKEEKHLAEIRNALKEKQWHRVTGEATGFERDLLVRLAEQHNAGHDPLDLIPSRTWASLDK